ncbi:MULTISPECIES: tRNA uridine-5-carboxymethylaminomethyl(34) synthesis enzyme MnmG [Segatella]|jgi:tRNA uridine 5-carboxymethylaminomethyl modification enzyme|uniref:tRNA uridine 5-carboxymethylaminomethyl modification enzyme MnmG n=1 Tax=Segatella copri TaxID=165179 RepID=A0A3E5E1J3_9BACT|nr:tRNA uridine-5-carboxymethylaminomethyl(34) synthesis enzyme MnmG [Segatella copri]MCW4076624.1 tRNA uridine-5-carboxymethylaminomethyl(34) synthesis enzyme MnmG [Segatella copri]MCW4093704.1 tRNA uridine-5-carboxymethylaminomethyl(34) synthesis enzyme MnmG [Segatella copri]MCW4109276.1 tRNA uridine-5-carboxymethylaminomethyl(34) synthesis enzyme MnmG [Segatella copri]MQM90177.1 tRNA uridine-5-carboxymethylaminomethyl(34) synthesis enzyme MnmG [Segatella copri]MQM96557.1 tRNA uridine-5-carb
MKFNYDVLVIGGGHAGCEAAAASANMGAKTCLITMDMNKIGQMSCNPAIGGIAKGQIVREIDALGGQMGIVTDKTAIQFRMLNIGKGPAVWSPRAQCDRGKFIWEWRTILDHTDNLDIWQDQADELLVANGEAIGVKTIWGAEFYAKSIIITAGTFLNGLMHVGRKMVEGGRCAEPAVHNFTESITRWGITTARMKTGTPVRIDKRSVHFEDMEEQPGDSDFHQFSYMGEHRVLKQLPCWTCYTNKKVHETLKSGLADSPLYNGQIQSTGPRYCPSIETKLVTFPDKDQHPLFLEPEGEDTNEMYLNGFSSSMPMDIQLNALHEIPALRDAKIYRPGYAIEYDYFDPTQLKHSLESKIIKGLFFAGQVNGTTGYEEAGGQGTVAGINAALHCVGDKTFEMNRDESYIGVLIDDLTTKGVDEPYRMFTSRAEYRILLRQDDADARLTEKAYELGIAKRDRYDWWIEKKEAIGRIIEFCANYPIKKDEINPKLEALGTTPLRAGCKLIDLIARPHLNLTNLSEIIPDLKAALDAPANRKEEITEAAEIKMKYKGYIERERLIADKMHRLEDIKIKGRFNYSELHEISTEGRQKLERIDPETLAQASRIPGVSPSDINVMLVLLGR